MNIKKLSKIFAAIIIAGLAGAIGSVFTGSAIQTWYTALARPSFAPPNFLFGPVWTTLYIFMGIASYLIFEKGWERKDVKRALNIYLAQLVLNALWSIVFFGLHAIGWALVVIIALWILILMTILSFRKISKPAAYLLVPYILWVTFATALNYGFFVLN